ncbi:MAG: tRNA uridine(34) 5-carboxymethylaminomethyl modification radical SAM/GNAT enzyme Elp3 [Nanoarchaeota archaeon]|nr:tRNA uridine(34) 5-carboxymethylaminomethyl modification radical SAM/GNAT enzyme Elp3 [Nanoarchaeota archaeon]
MSQSQEELNSFYFDLINEITSIEDPNPTKINTLKTKIAKKYKVNSVVKNPQILGYARDDYQREQLVKIFNTKPIREASGVTVVALFAIPHACPHGKCMYCPGGPGSPFGDTPQSYTGHEPAAMRAKRNMYDPYMQIFNRLEHYIANGHDPDKLELIFMGGTFPSLSLEYRDEFVKYVYKAINDFGDLFFEMTPEGKRIIRYDIFNEFFEMTHHFNSQERQIRVQEKMLQEKFKNDILTLEEQIEKNETAIIRSIGLTVETKPDWALESHCRDMLRYGCTRLEIGVQTLNENCLKKTNRGHTLEETKRCFQIAKDLCLKMNAHMMLGLPASNLQIDEEGLVGLFEEEAYRPDMLKIYPCLVVDGTPLYNMYKLGLFEPITTEKAAEIIARSYAKFPRYVRVMRVQRDIPTTLVEGGVQKSNLRQYVEEEMKKLGVESKDVRAREIGLRQLEEQRTQHIKKEIKLLEKIEFEFKNRIKQFEFNSSFQKLNVFELLPQNTNIYRNIEGFVRDINALEEVYIDKIDEVKAIFEKKIENTKNEKVVSSNQFALQITKEFTKEYFNSMLAKYYITNFNENTQLLNEYVLSQKSLQIVEENEEIDEKINEEFNTLNLKIQFLKQYTKKLVEYFESITHFAINVEEFNSSEGVDIFLDVVNTDDTLIGFTRLRFPKQTNLTPEIHEKTALIRELHIYGQTIPVGAQAKDEIVQHKGWGRKLIFKAEEIAKQRGYTKMVIISGVGVREYYKKLGYHKEGTYMVKELF